MKTTRKPFLLAAALAFALALAGCEKKTDAITSAEQADKQAGIGAPGLEETKAIAEEAFIYGLPLVMNYAVMNEYVVDRNSGQYKAPFNTVSNEARVITYKDTAVVTPNSDTPYSMVWLDLRAEPVVISVPAVDKARYYSVQLTDGNAYNYGYTGSRATGTDAGNYLVVGPGWNGEAPAGIKQVFRSTTPFALTIFRTQLFNAGDMPNVVKVQSGYKAQPLSAFLKQPAPPEAPKTDFLPATTAGIKANFYEYLDAALQFMMTQVLNPLTSELEAKEEGHKIKYVLMHGTKFSLLIALPICTVFSDHGKKLHPPLDGAGIRRNIRDGSPDPDSHASLFLGAIHNGEYPLRNQPPQDSGDLSRDRGSSEPGAQHYSCASRWGLSGWQSVPPFPT